MANWKSRSDDQIWWESQPGNRGKTYPGDELASKQYERNKAAGENNLSAVRNFLFGKSDARKQGVEDAVNARRDAGKSIPLEPYRKPELGPTKKDWDLLTSIRLGPSDKNSDEYPKDEYGNTSLKESKGGKISLKDCKVSTHTKNKKQSNW